MKEKLDEKVGLAFYRGKQSQHRIYRPYLPRTGIRPSQKEHDEIHGKCTSQCLIAQNKAKWTAFNRYQGDMKRAERDKVVWMLELCRYRSV